MKHYTVGLTRKEAIEFKIHYILLKDILEAYCTVHVTGGSLHVVLDEGDWKRESIEHCLIYAAKVSDHIGVAICNMLLEAPDQFIKDCDELDWLLACERWSRNAKY